MVGVFVGLFDVVVVKEEVGRMLVVVLIVVSLSLSVSVSVLEVTVGLQGMGQNIFTRY